MNFGREDDEEGARGERQCGRAAQNPMISAHMRIADDVYYKDNPSLPTSDLSGSCARACSAERPRARVERENHRSSTPNSSCLPRPPALRLRRHYVHIVSSSGLKYSPVEPGWCRAAPPHLTTPRSLQTCVTRLSRMTLLRAPESSASQTNGSAWPASGQSTPHHPSGTSHYLSLRAVAS